MSKHTPGPWRVDDCDKGIWVETQDEVAVCRILRDGKWTLDQARQHARLIAAAPKMYSLLAMIAESGNNDAKAIIKEIGNEKSM